MAVAASVHFKVRCHYCSKRRLPQDIDWTMKIGGAYRCHYCTEKHDEAMAALMAGRIPTQCQECKVHFFNQADPQTGDCTVVVVWKDQTLQVLCRRCADAYERKRLDLYGDTIYGERKKLKGAK